MNDRPNWQALPISIQDAVEAQIGSVKKIETVECSRPGFAARVYAAHDDVFLKAVPRTSPSAELHRRERWAARHLRPSARTPRLLWDLDKDRWHVSAFELINDHTRRADLRPGSPDLPAVLATMAELGQMLAPSPGGARPVIEHVNGLWATARLMLDQPPGDLHQRDLYLTTLNEFTVDDLRGDTMLHGDLSPRHLLIKDGTVYVVGWSRVSFGAGWIDAALLAPQLVAAGHTPEQADALLSTVPTWRQAPMDQVAGLTAVWTLYHRHKARYGAQERSDACMRLADAGQAWLAHRLARP
ncbi:phosphotransferase family protein [Nonomuraea turcica]|uniref:phosphotransferase family protein n=1 Tax=Nonomuraea sp. G32 TaxID=3067274 RepID=UPI00273AAB8D|nr:phosphotransferase [Nonomuraea sp. G32]MDP4511751.1 phosphotransferase [Nonomuraea sp. G32]